MDLFLFIVSTVFSYVKSKKLKDAARRAAEDAAGVLLNQETTNAYLQVIYGRRRAGGVKRVLGSLDVPGGDKNEYLYMALLVCEGTINSLSEIEIDDDPITHSKFNGLVTWEYHLGADDQAASTLLQQIPGWTENHRFAGIAYVALRFKWDSKRVVFSDNPNVTVITEGRTLFDPRTGVTAYSTNPALVTRDYKTNPRYGKGLAAARIDDVSYSLATNDYEETVEYVTGSGALGRLHEFNAVIDTGKTLFDNLQIMQTGCRGLLPYSQGKYGLYCDKARPVSMHFDASNTRPGIKVVGEKKSNKYNQVRVTWVNPNNSWQSETAIWPAKDSVASLSYLAEDQVELIYEIDMPTCTNGYAALDFARLLCVRSRSGKRLVLPATAAAFALSVPDTISVTHTTPGFRDKQFQIESLGLSSDGECVISGTEYDPSVYSYDNDVEQTVYADTTISDPSVVAPVSNLKAVGAVQSESDGGYLSAIDVSFDAPLDSFVDSYEITFVGSDSSQEIVLIRTTNYRQTNLNATATYTVSVSAVNSVGFRSAPISVIGVSPSIDTVAPGAPTNPSVIGTFKQINLGWTNPVDSDFRHVEIKRSGTNVEADAVYLDRTDSGSYSDSGYTQQVTRYYWLRSVDRTGNASDWIAAGGGTALPLVASDFDAGVIDFDFLSDDVQSTLDNAVSADDFVEEIANIDLDIGAIESELNLKATTFDLNVIIDQAQRTGDTIDLVAERMLDLALTQSETLGLVSDAGIVVDPATGSVTIQAVQALSTEVNTRINNVSVDLSAAESQISLKASVAYVNNTIASAVLNASDLESLNALEAKISQAEIDISGAEATILLKSDVTTVSGLDVRLQQAEIDINAADEAIELKVNNTQFGPLATRVQTAEQTLSTIDAPAIAQTVIDSRAINNAVELNAINSLQDLLNNYHAQTAIKTDLAFAQTSITADVNDLRESTATSRLELASLIDANQATIVSESQTRATETAANASLIEALTASVGSNTSSLQTESTARSDADSAIAQTITALNSAVADKAESTAVETLNTRVKKSEETITSEATKLLKLESNLSGTDTDVASNATAVSGLNTRVKKSEKTITSQATSITALTSGLADTDTSVASNATAVSGLDTKVKKSEETITSQANSITALTSGLADTDTSLASNAAAVSGLNTRVQNAEGSVSSQATAVTALSSSVGSNTSSISTQATTIDGIKSQFSVTTDVNGHVSGFGLISEIIAGVPASAFIVSADQFAIGGANNADGSYPFVHYANATTVTVDGVSVTIPAGTYIESAKINYLSANIIKVGKLSAQRISVDGQTIEAYGNRLKIKNLGVDTLQIAGNAVTIPRSTTSASTLYLPRQSWYTINRIVFLPANVGGSAQPVSIKAFIPFRAKDAGGNGGEGYLEYRIRKNNAVVSGPIEFTKRELEIFGSYPNTYLFAIGPESGAVSPIYLDTSTSLAQRSYTLEVKFTNQSSSFSGGFNVPAGAVLECTEVKR